MPDRTELGLLLQRIREERGESLTSMAERLKMTKAYLSAIELGNRRTPAGFADRVTSSYDLSRDVREELYRACSTRGENCIRRQVFISMIVDALADYDITFLAGLCMGLCPEEGEERPTAVEVAVLGKGSHRDADNNCVASLDFLEVGILEEALSGYLGEQRAYLLEPMPDGIGFEEWLEITDFKRSEYRRCKDLFEKIVGRPYDPSDYEDEDSEYDECEEDD